MVAAAHPGELRHGHVAGDALVARAAGLVMRVLGGIVDLVFVAGHARLVGLVLRLEPYRPLGVWQWLQSSLPDFAQGLISHEVYV